MRFGFNIRQEKHPGFIERTDRPQNDGVCKNVGIYVKFQGGKLHYLKKE